MPLSDRRATAPAVPPMLVTAGGWAWRLLALGVAGYAVVWVLSKLALVVLPILGALFLSALLRPPTRVLDRYMPRLAAAWLTLLLAAVVVGGLGYFVGLRAANQAPQVVTQLITTVSQLLDRLQGLPMVSQLQLNQIQQRIVGFLRQNLQVTNILLTAARRVVEFVTGLLLMVFVTFFFVYRGERIWGWIVARLPARPGTRINRAGKVAWHTLYGWITGTFVIAVFHGIVIGVTLLALGAPLVAPLALLVFAGSFIPFVGALVAGSAAVLVTLGTEGLLDALILLAVLIVENQLEGNVLQPLVMGHYVRLSPLVIGIVLVVGSVLFGIVGAIVAVPATAVVYRTLPVLLRRDDAETEVETEAAQEPLPSAGEAAAGHDGRSEADTEPA